MIRAGLRKMKVLLCYSILLSITWNNRYCFFVLYEIGRLMKMLVFFGSVLPGI